MNENNKDKKWECPKTLNELLEQLEQQKEAFHELGPDINEEDDDQTILNKLSDQANKQLRSAEKLHEGIKELIDSLKHMLEAMEEWQKEIDDGLFEKEE
jgi:DNA repair ATPase RecN